LALPTRRQTRAKALTTTTLRSFWAPGGGLPRLPWPAKKYLSGTFLPKHPQRIELPAGGLEAKSARRSLLHQVGSEGEVHRPTRVSPVFPAQEVARLVRATADLKPNYRSPLRREVFRLAIVLLYTTGLRHGELRRLTVGDYDSREHTLLVRASKFHKSRLLPLSPDGVRELNAYLVARQAQGLSLAAEAPLLWNRAQGGRPYTAVGLGAGVRLLLKATGINTPSGRRPRIHDFRHTFAVHALVRWYREGVDVQAKLPYLATYLGHVSIVSTQYYLHFVEELSQCASDRFAQHCGSLVTLPSEVQGGVR